MKTIRRYWLELFFSVLLAVVVVASALGFVRDIPVNHGRPLKQSNQKISETKLSKYLQEIERLHDCTAILCVKDIQGYPIPEDALEELKGMGFANTATLSAKDYHSFIGIWSNGKVVYEQIGGDELITHGQYFHDHYIYVQSATFNAENVGNIYIDNIQYSVQERGLNIVVIDNKTFSLVDTINFDTFEAGAPASRRE